MFRCSPARLVREFHKLAGQPTRKLPAWPNEIELELRRRLVREESKEVLEALAPNRGPLSPRRRQTLIANAAHELADLVYVCYGAAQHLGIDLDQVIAEVHRANVQKVHAGAQFRHDGKVLKPRHGWRPADVKRAIFGGNVHRED